jgi:hypothetical protein
MPRSLDVPFGGQLIHRFGLVNGVVRPINASSLVRFG